MLRVVTAAINDGNLSKDSSIRGSRHAGKRFENDEARRDFSKDNVPAVEIGHRVECDKKLRAVAIPVEEKSKAPVQHHL